jgi:hypothetical protein
MKMPMITRKDILERRYQRALDTIDVATQLEIEDYRCNLKKGEAARNISYDRVMGKLLVTLYVRNGAHHWSYIHNVASNTIEYTTFATEFCFDGKRLDEAEPWYHDHRVIDYSHSGIVELSRVPDGVGMWYDGRQLKADKSVLLKTNRLTSLAGLDCDELIVESRGTIIESNGIHHGTVISFANQRNLTTLDGAPILAAALVDLSFNRLSSWATTAKITCHELWILDCDFTSFYGISRTVAYCHRLQAHTVNIDDDSTFELFMVPGLHSITTANPAYDKIVNDHLISVANGSVPRRTAMLRCQLALRERKWTGDMIHAA